MSSQPMRARPLRARPLRARPMRARPIRPWPIRATPGSYGPAPCETPMEAIEPAITSKVSFESKNWEGADMVETRRREREKGITSAGKTGMLFEQHISLHATQSYVTKRCHEKNVLYKANKCKKKGQGGALWSTHTCV